MFIQELKAMMSGMWEGLQCIVLLLIVLMPIWLMLCIDRFGWRFWQW